MSKISPAVIRGLDYAKYFYKKAIEQSELAGFYSKLAVLMFDDAIEIFLHMAYIQNDKTKELQEGDYPDLDERSVTFQSVSFFLKNRNF